jgi:hypothetical protein
MRGIAKGATTLVIAPFTLIIARPVVPAADVMDS